MKASILTPYMKHIYTPVAQSCQKAAATHCMMAYMVQLMVPLVTVSCLSDQLILHTRSAFVWQCSCKQHQLHDQYSECQLPHTSNQLHIELQLHASVWTCPSAFVWQCSQYSECQLPLILAAPSFTLSMSLFGNNSVQLSRVLKLPYMEKLLWVIHTYLCMHAGHM